MNDLDAALAVTQYGMDGLIGVVSASYQNIPVVMSNYLPKDAAYLTPLRDSIPVMRLSLNKKYDGSLS